MLWMLGTLQRRMVLCKMLWMLRCATSSGSEYFVRRSGSCAVQRRLVINTSQHALDAWYTLQRRMLLRKMLWMLRCATSYTEYFATRSGCYAVQRRLVLRKTLWMLRCATSSGSEHFVRRSFGGSGPQTVQKGARRRE